MTEDYINSKNLRTLYISITCCILIKNRTRNWYWFNRDSLSLWLIMERSTVSFVLLNPDTFESESEPTMDLSLSQWEFREKIKACVVLPCAPAVISGTKEQVPLSRTSTMVADTIDASGEHTHTDQSNPNDSEMTGSGYTNSSAHTATPKVDSLRVMPVRRGILLDQQPNPSPSTPSLSTCRSPSPWQAHLYSMIDWIWFICCFNLSLCGYGWRQPSGWSLVQDQLCLCLPQDHSEAPGSQTKDSGWLSCTCYSTGLMWCLHF